MAVTFDAVGPSSAGTAKTIGGTGSDTLTWSHTCSGSNRLLVVGIGAGIDDLNDGNASVSVTYNGVALTSTGKISVDGAGFSQLFYLVNPHGSHTVSASIAITAPSGVNTIEGGSISFNGVDQGTPIRNVTTNSGEGSSSNVTVNSAVGNVVVDVAVCGSSFVSSDQTQRWNDNFSGHTGAGNAAQSTANGASSVTMGYSNGADEWSMVAMDVVAAISGSIFADSIAVALTSVIGETAKLTAKGAASIATTTNIADSNKYTAKPSAAVAMVTSAAASSKATFLGAAAFPLSADFAATFGGLVTAAISLSATAEMTADNAMLVSALCNVGASTGFALGTQLNANAAASLSAITDTSAIGNAIIEELISLGLTADAAMLAGKLLQEAITVGLSAAIDSDGTALEIVVAALVAEAVRVVQALSAEDVRVLQNLVAESVRVES